MQRSAYLLIGSLVATIAISWVDLSQGLIIIPCHHSGIHGWWLCLVEAFNLIEFFGVAALFGWFTFSVAGDDFLKHLRAKGVTEDELVTKVRTIGDYFVLSFVLYGVSALADYLFFHYTIFGASHSYFFASLAFLAFGFGTLVLTCPVIYLWRLQHKQEIFVQGVEYAFVLSLATIADIIALTLVMPKSADSRWVVMVPSISAFAGLYLGMTRSLTIGTILRFLCLLAICWAVLGILVLIGITSFSLL